ncbi:MAG: Biotin carboxyl carrier protein of acetyl-CoA carboxylase [Deltaproteobacteria bacterium]|nr:Biotin carboxyl carrier protein of acetyl-CoA carboxylase [Deltaproteobacteria bacterium]
MTRSGGRLHAPHQRVVLDAPTGGDPVTKLAVRAPMPGHFIPAIDDGDLVMPDEVIGQLVVLGRSIALVAGMRGLAAETGAPRAVAYGEPLFAIDLAASIVGDELAIVADATLVTGKADRELVFRAPTSGRFYTRAAPDKPPFIASGVELATGATVCLLEVMKTFHRVTYGGDDLPERARIRSVLVRDGDDVNAGDALLALDPIG